MTLGQASTYFDTGMNMDLRPLLLPQHQVLLHQMAMCHQFLHQGFLHQEVHHQAVHHQAVLHRLRGGVDGSDGALNDVINRILNDLPRTV